MGRFDCTLNVFSSGMDELKETTKWIRNLHTFPSPTENPTQANKKSIFCPQTSLFFIFGFSGSFPEDEVAEVSLEVTSGSSIFLNIVVS
jgi:hypothetical protein